MLTLFKFACNEFRIPDEEKIDLINYSLVGTSQTHFLPNRISFAHFSDTEFLLKSIYDCAARQLQVVGKLEPLRYRHHVADKDISDRSEGLKSFV